MLPAYLVGFGLAGVFARQRDTVRRLRIMVFALLAPFYFLNAGVKVYLPALWAGLGLVVILLVVRIAAKVVSVWPLARMFGMAPRESNYTTLLMVDEADVIRQNADDYFRQIGEGLVTVMDAHSAWFFLDPSQ